MAFVKSQAFSSTFDGQPVNATLLPLTLEALMDIQDAPPKSAEMVRRYQTHVPNFVKNLSLMLNGEPVSVEDICTYAYFAALLGELGSTLVRATRPENPTTPAADSAG